MTARAILISSTGSGTGKTTLTAGLLRAFRRRGLSVRAAKSGPDYIDPLFHRAAAGTASVNLDSWAMPPPLLDDLVARAAADGDFLIIEGAMGLFDGGAGARGQNAPPPRPAPPHRLPLWLLPHSPRH